MRPRRPWIAPCLIAVAALAAYANSFHGAFVFDDPSSISGNPTIRHLWPLWPVLKTPHVSVTAAGRPLVNLSLALNYAWGGVHVWGYHAVNLSIQIAAGLTLLGILRRTLRDEAVACGAALWWTVHPVQTEAVTYIVQRAESLMGLFFLLTLYLFIRGRPALSVLACLCGMATKEVTAVAPFLVLLYDRTFLAGSFAAALRRRRYYAALFATLMLVIALVVAGGGNRSGSVGFGVHVSWLAWFLTQFQAIGRYLLLAVWPHPLVFEYGIFWVRRAAEILPWALIVLPPLIFTAVALRRWPRWGFAGAWFFAILAPTTLVPGTSQMIVEHRLYLSLAAPLAALAIALRRTAPAAVFAIAGAWVVLTAARNREYRSETVLWTDTVTKRPANQLAQTMLGQALMREDRNAAALDHLRKAVQLDPGFAIAHELYGEALYRAGDRAEAVAHYRTALRIQPKYTDASDNLGMALASAGRRVEAERLFRETLEVNPDYAPARYNLAGLLADEGRRQEAVAEYEAALRIDPHDARTEYNLANTLFDLNRLPEAVAHYQAALRDRRDYPEAEYNLGNALALSGRPAEAIAHYREALRQRPRYPEAECNWGSALVNLNRLHEARAHFEAALRLDPNFADARTMLRRLDALQP